MKKLLTLLMALVAIIFISTPVSANIEDKNEAAIMLLMSQDFSGSTADSGVFTRQHKLVEALLSPNKVIPVGRNDLDFKMKSFFISQIEMEKYYMIYKVDQKHVYFFTEKLVEEKRNWHLMPLLLIAPLILVPIILIKMRHGVSAWTLLLMIVSILTTVGVGMIAGANAIIAFVSILAMIFLTMAYSTTHRMWLRIAMLVLYYALTVGQIVLLFT